MSILVGLTNDSVLSSFLQLTTTTKELCLYCHFQVFSILAVLRASLPAFNVTAPNTPCPPFPPKYLSWLCFFFQLGPRRNNISHFFSVLREDIRFISEASFQRGCFSVTPAQTVSDNLTLLWWWWSRSVWRCSRSWPKFLFPGLNGFGFLGTTKIWVKAFFFPGLLQTEQCRQAGKFLNNRKRPNGRQQPPHNHLA